MKKIVLLFLLIAFASKQAILSVSPISFTKDNLDNGLVLWYTFDGDVKDKSGNKNHPSFVNATPTADRFGKANSAYYFNGIDNYIQTPNSTSLNPAKQLSISAWIRVDGFYRGTCHGNSILMKGNTDYLGGNYLLRFDDNLYTEGSNCFIKDPNAKHQNFYGAYSVPAIKRQVPFIQTGEWYSVVYVCDGITGKLFMDGKLISTGPVTKQGFKNSYDLFLGKMNDTQYPYWFHGAMDELKIYNRALNENEIGELANTESQTPVAECEPGDKPTSKFIPQELLDKKHPVVPCKIPAVK